MKDAKEVKDISKQKDIDNLETLLDSEEAEALSDGGDDNMAYDCD